MATYELPYAEEHLRELFQEARAGEDVIIVRRDGRSCQLLPLADVGAGIEEIQNSRVEARALLVPA